MTRALPAPEKHQLDIGYVRLTDSAPLIVAAERGLFAAYGLRVRLHREVSWANVRDKLTVGALDAAQMLAPLPAMTAHGASGVRVPMLSALTLSHNGNTVTLGGALWHEVRMRCAGDPTPEQTARALQAVIRSRAGRTGIPTLAVVHAFSTHTLLLRRWLQSGGIDPDRDVRTIIVPPAQMVDSLANGVIEGFCVGEPWGSVAVHHGLGAIAALGCEIWPGSPEKVLAVTQRWHEHHPTTHLRLRLALMEACAWLQAAPENRREAAMLLAAPGYLDLPEAWLVPSLTGKMRLEPRGEPRDVADCHRFGAGIDGFPWRCQAEALIEECGQLLGRAPRPEQVAALAQQTTRPDLFRAAARQLGVEAPPSDRREARHGQHRVSPPGPSRGRPVR